MSFTRPKWWQLYALFGLLIALLALQARLPLSPRGHEFAQIGIVLAIFALVFRWVGANEAALSQAERKRATGQRQPRGGARSGPAGG